MICLQKMKAFAKSCILKIKYTSAIQYHVFNIKIKGNSHIAKETAYSSKAILCYAYAKRVTNYYYDYVYKVK